MRYQHKSRDGQPFKIYALVCPRSLLVRYVGQTSTDLEQRTLNHTAYHFKGAMREWLTELGSERPIVLVLEEGVNRIVRMRSGWRRERKGRDGTRPARIRLWYSSVRETVWQLRFRRTLYNETPLESVEVAALLSNPLFPWDSNR